MILDDPETRVCIILHEAMAAIETNLDRLANLRPMLDMLIDDASLRQDVKDAIDSYLKFRDKPR